MFATTKNQPNRIETSVSLSSSSSSNSTIETKTKLQLKKLKFVKFSCSICHTPMKTHALLVQHLRTHDRNDSQASILASAAVPAPSLQQPKRLDSLAKALQLIECEWCPEVFPTISKAIQHKFRKHKHESTNYFCKQCGKLFPLTCALEQHMHAEHPAKIVNPTLVVSKTDAFGAVTDVAADCNDMFGCLYCAERFASAAAVECHERGAHHIQKRLMAPTVLPPPSKKIKLNNMGEILSLYYCHLCGCEYMMKYNLSKHLDACHLSEEKEAVPADGIIQCKACEAIFFNDRAYRAHNIHHRPDDLYVTSEEQRQQVVNRVDQDYDMRRVPALNGDMASSTSGPLKCERNKSEANKKRRRCTDRKASTTTATTMAMEQLQSFMLSAIAKPASSSVSDTL